MKFWFNRPRNTVETPKIEPKPKVMLHGHDLEKWNYLGYTTCSYVSDSRNITSSYPIFFFVDKNDLKRRSYFVSGDSSGYVERTHTYINRMVKPWAAGEGSIYGVVHNSKGEAAPSDFLKEYMLEHYKATWNSEACWWDVTDQAKYSAATKKQSKKTAESPNVKSEDGNVVTLEFGKQPT
jgi:hypothetical protein